MNVIRHTDKDFSARLREVTSASSLFDAGIEQRTRAIVEAVHTRGDDAVLEFTARFDGATLAAAARAVRLTAPRAVSSDARLVARAPMSARAVSAAARASVACGGGCGEWVEGRGWGHWWLHGTPPRHHHTSKARLPPP